MTAEQIIAILVDRLGGDVKITEREVVEAPELESLQDPTQIAWILRTRRRPQIVEGEVTSTPNPRVIEYVQQVVRDEAMKPRPLVFPVIAPGA